ncbi:MAG: A/G-specific adenine glycosylase, partial [bacterium]|nr:A/G-specific adenine glycosylase [bacterium]
MIATAQIRALRSRLLNWYRRNHRKLPWRATRDPYLIWIAEIMLQQTRVAAVLPYYERFIDRFPTIEALAGAPIDEVLTYWAGLGYYSRARNLHAAAGAIAAEGFPADYTAIRALPGIGDYTAAAIASSSRKPGNTSSAFARALAASRAAPSASAAAVSRSRNWVSAASRASSA